MAVDDSRVQFMVERVHDPNGRASHKLGSRLSDVQGWSWFFTLKDNECLIVCITIDFLEVFEKLFDENSADVKRNC